MAESTNGDPTDSKPIDENVLEFVRREGQPGGSAITLRRACWLVWPVERESGARAAMSQAQFVHFNAPVLAVQRNGRMEYFDEDGRRRWSSNLAWPRANLEMARLPGRADGFEEPPAENDSAED